MKARGIIKTIAVSFGIAAAVSAIISFVVFVCADIVDWPYFRPIVADGFYMHQERSDFGNGPVVAYAIGQDAEIRVGAFCYPRQKTRVQACLLRIGLEQPPGGEASFESVGLAVRDATGRDLVDREAVKKHPLLAPVIPGTVLLAEAVLPEKFSVLLPGVRMGSTVAHVPELLFERIEKKQCVPLFVNY